MNSEIYVRAVLALFFIILLILLAAHLMKKLGYLNLATARKSANEKKIIIKEIAFIDQKNKIIQVELKDERELTILLGQQSETILQDKKI